MNESLRKVKIDYSYTANKVRVEWWKNFCLGLIITGPVFVIPFGRYFWRM